MRQSRTKRGDVEELGLFWAMNPERHRLRRELPFIAAVLDACAGKVGSDRIHELQEQEIAREKQRRAARHRATKSNELRKRTLRHTLRIKKEMSE